MASTLVWTCRTCGSAVDDFDGVLRCADGRGPWRPVHFFPHPEAERPYGMGVERLRTPEALLAWTEHLLGQDWCIPADWAALLGEQRRALGLPAAS